MKLPKWLLSPFTTLAERYYPEPFVFAVVMTLLTLVCALLATDTTPAGALQAWGDGLPSLLSFTAQLSITLLSAHALAHTDQVQRLLKKIGGIPRNASAAYSLVALTAGTASLIAWSLGLVVGAAIARHVAIECSKRGIRVHYPLLVASAYGGFVIWHMGYSASAPLFVATEGHSLQAEMGIIPITETIFTLNNAVLAGIALAAVAILCPLMRPDEKDIIEVDRALLDEPSNNEVTSQDVCQTPAQKLENLRPLSASIGLALLAYIAYSFHQKGFYLTLDIVNWSFVAAGLLLARSPRHYVQLIEGAGGAVGPIILMYPFYAGILGLMTGTGLAGVISDFFASVASAETLGMAAFFSAGLINLFIPSGGGQWAVQGPIFVEAANLLQVDHSVVVLAVAYGDQWTNMIQPFWTIPLLAIAGLKLRQIMGYTVMIFLVTGVIFSAGLLSLGSG
ncbi:short-chain fatty acid transporter [Spongiibacter sp. KMU-166]|uniref:Short-chain fatty acid transporter n=1 Tax=Spongiibacter thalassae TaxID=2721624 RepID=A0ABX1GBH7_9GAMM|nr:TIGR00366 family protein [Spongiibacter thalassae]NKI15953.1 short-chain fatty acid transporter [Spongiibacter thalassae]